MASKVSFRARTLDAHKLMPVFGADELPDLAEYAAINRQVASMPTGMEKDEELELHLVEAMTAQQQTNIGNTTSEVIIPTPRVTSDIKHYEDIYNSEYKPPPALIKVEASLNVEPQLCEYDADSDDERWLCSRQANSSTSITYDDFESIMDRLEKNSERQVITLREARALMPAADDDVLAAVYDYWIDKRMKHRHALCPRVRTERRETTTNGANAVPNPYIAFRRRAERMRTRVNRKNDEDGYEKMLKLMSDLRRASNLFEMVKRREKTKRELIALAKDEVERRHRLQDWNGAILRECERDARPQTNFAKRTKERKRKKDEGLASMAWLQQMAAEWHRAQPFPTSPPPSHAPRHSRQPSAITGVLEMVDKLASHKTSQEIDGDFAFKRHKGCVYHAPAPVDNTNERVNKARAVLEGRLHESYHRTYVRSHPPLLGGNVRLKYIGMTRRRLGRGGRVVFDRLSGVSDENMPHTMILPHDADEQTPSSSGLKQVDREHDYFRPRLTGNASVESDPVLAASAADDDDDISLVCRALPCVDSGYSSPTRSRSRNGTSTVRPVPRDVPYALVRGARGDLCSVPITIGVSPALYEQHRRRVQQHFATPSTSNENNDVTEPPPLPLSPTTDRTLSIDRVKAFQACAAVQDAKFAENLLNSIGGGQYGGARYNQPPLSINGHHSSEQHLDGDNTGGNHNNNAVLINASNAVNTSHHHPLPTPSPSPNDDNAKHMKVDGSNLHTQGNDANTDNHKLIIERMADGSAPVPKKALGTPPAATTATDVR